MAKATGKQIVTVDPAVDDDRAVRHYVLKGSAGAIVFSVYLPRRSVPRDIPCAKFLGWHSRRPLDAFSQDRGPNAETCCWLEGDACWGDGSVLEADKLVRASDNLECENAIWHVLGEWYERMLDEAEDDIEQENTDG